MIEETRTTDGSVPLRSSLTAACRVWVAPSALTSNRPRHRVAGDHAEQAGRVDARVDHQGVEPPVPLVDLAHHRGYRRGVGHVAVRGLDVAAGEAAISAAALVVRSRSRPWAMTVRPVMASLMATARPMPVVEPVTRTTRGSQGRCADAVSLQQPRCLGE